VLLDKTTFDALEIWQAGRVAVAKRLSEPGSKARNDRQSLGISQFKSIAYRVWPPLDLEVTGQPSRTTMSQPQRDVRAAARPSQATIGALVAELLMDVTLDYNQIVHRVCAAFPHANTSTKSVFSTARDLRKRGVPVPMRGGYRPPN
jgi:hypothetical protein